MDNNYGNMNDTNNTNNTNSTNNNTNNVNFTMSGNPTIRMSHRRLHRLIIHQLKAIHRATIHIRRLLQQDSQM